MHSHFPEVFLLKTWQSANCKLVLLGTLLNTFVLNFTYKVKIKYILRMSSGCKPSDNRVCEAVDSVLLTLKITYLCLYINYQSERNGSSSLIANVLDETCWSSVQK